MKVTWKKIISLLLACALLAVNMPQNAFAKEKAPEFTFTHVNPEYAELVGNAKIEIPEVVKSEAPAVSTYATKEFLTDEYQIAACIREGMRNRQTTFEIYVNGDDVTQEMFDRWIELTFIETDNPKEGDYLAKHYKSVSTSWSGTSAPTGSEYQWDFTGTFYVEYYTTYEQEEELDAEVENVMKELGISDKNSDYVNLKLIYDYICENIVYDYDNLNDSSYFLKYSAYAAMINKTAVCQGYANLLYYMGRLAGIDMRYISGYGNGGAHGWNIAKMDDMYYNLDSTWDAGRYNYSYFLVGSDNFKDHDAKDQYKTEEFMTKYPISKTNYVYVEPEIPDEPEDPVKPENPFSDVNESDWFYDATQYVYQEGLMSGSDGNFKPNDNMTRAMMVTTLYRMEGSPEVTDYTATSLFGDIEAGSWYEDAVNWAYNEGVTTGYPELKLFGSNDNVTREQLAVFLHRYADKQGLDVTKLGDVTSLRNHDKTSDYATEGISWAVGTGLISGVQTFEDGVPVYDLAPQGSATRAQLATILMRFCEYYEL